jgi:sarcosine oxidase subunit beta
MNDVTVDVVVLGAGVIGAATACALARRGLRVALVDRDTGEPAAPAASWASAGGVRSQNRKPAEWKLTRAAAALWPDLAADLEADLEWVRGGHLHVAESEAEAEAVAARVAREQAGGIAIELLQGRALREVVPGIGASALAGAFTRGDGQANPPRTVLAYRAAAARAGCVLRLGEPATLRVVRGRVEGVATPSGAIHAARVVLAAGAWSEALLAPHGVTLPLRRRALQMLLSDPEGEAMTLRPTITAERRRLSLKQVPGGAYLLGGSWPAKIGAGDRIRLDGASIAGSWAHAVGIWPAIARCRAAQAWAGIEAQTPDGLPLVGECPGLAGLMLACGFSNHGFQLAPAVGPLLADLVLGTAPDWARALDPARLAQLDPAALAAFRAEPNPIPPALVPA